MNLRILQILLLEMKGGKSTQYVLEEFERLKEKGNNTSCLV